MVIPPSVKPAEALCLIQRELIKRRHARVVFLSHVEEVCIVTVTSEVTVTLPHTVYS
jgi:hypothetical protein